MYDHVPRILKILKAIPLDRWENYNRCAIGGQEICFTNRETSDGECTNELKINGYYIQDDLDYSLHHFGYKLGLDLMKFHESKKLECLDKIEKALGITP